MANRPPLPHMPSSLLFRGPAIRDAQRKRRFYPPTESTKPLDIFQPAMNRGTYPGPRYIRESDRYQVLLLTAGAVVDGKAGFCVVFRPNEEGETRDVRQRLEADGEQTLDRAALRAAVAAASMRVWWGEGFGKIVIATSSAYVANGACRGMAEWKAKGWIDGNGEEVRNKDLWEILLAKAEEYEAYGVSVHFWMIQEEWNEEAKQGAQAGAQEQAVPESYSEISVVMC